MNLVFVRHLWGVTDTPAVAVPRFVGKGYTVIESPPPAEDREAFFDLLGEHGLEFIAQGFTVGPDVAAHVADFRKQYDAANNMGAVLFNAHSGRDAFTDDQADDYFREVLAIERDGGLPVAHETHRGRILFTPWATRRAMEKHPDLQLCCDYSHWVCVCERLPDEPEIFALSAERCLHLHARVGFAEGPQVPDPRADGYKAEVDGHFAWWRQIVETQRKAGAARLTVTPEFGPPRYLHTDPADERPLADLEAVCDWTRDEFARRLG